MRSTRKAVWPLFFGLTLLFGALVAFAGDDIEDDVTPGVEARVSRISFIRGDVQIRREGSQDWEKAVLNLPIVEGDEIVTDANSRLEIQLGVYSHVRLAESSYLRVVGLKDGAVALSLAEGTLNARLTKFDKDAGYFEIDAPKTTVAIQKSGMYRIDAGRPGESSDVRVTVTDDGQAHVYADNSGFTLKNRRSATLRIDGPLAGEWETLDAAQFADEFDSWSLERDAVIAKALKDSYYDKYYDQDIYGAEDLNDNGQWIYTKKYGHVWRPYRSAISSYANWSPYRYGTWRWVPPYGWTWVNDEPWAWATYHHGRWFYDDGYWNWAPYGYTRSRRSWWFPALVGVRIVQQNIYWYPLPTGYGYFNYNQCFGGWGGHNNNWGNNWGGNHNGGHNNGGNNNGGHNNGNGGPVPTPTPRAYVGPLAGQLGPSVFTNNDSRQTWRLTPPLLRVPPGAVVGTSLSAFGRGKPGYGRIPDGDARTALSTPLGEIKPARILPTYQELDGQLGTAIKAVKPRMTTAITKPTGAAIRQADGGPMDQTLRQTKIFGGRDPIKAEPAEGILNSKPRKTGAVTRDPIRAEAESNIKPGRETREIKPAFGGDDPIRAEPPPRPSKPRNTGGDDPIRVEPTPPPSKPRNNPEDDPIRAEPPPRPSKPRNNVGDDPIRVEPSPRPSKPRYDGGDAPARQPRSEPPPRSEPVRVAPTRSEPPPSKSEPPRSFTPRREPSPSKPEPSRASPSEGRKKDN